MAEVAGNTASIAFTNFQTNAKNWTVDYAVDLEEVTDFADGTAKQYLPTLKDWTATIEYNWHSGNTAAALGTSATLELTVDAGSKYTGTAWLQSFSVNTPVGGIVTQTAVFQGNAVLALGAV